MGNDLSSNKRIENWRPGQDPDDEDLDEGSIIFDNVRSYREDDPASIEDDVNIGIGRVNHSNFADFVLDMPRNYNKIAIARGMRPESVKYVFEFMMKYYDYYDTNREPMITGDILKTLKDYMRDVSRRAFKLGISSAQLYNEEVVYMIDWFHEFIESSVIWGGGFDPYKALHKLWLEYIIQK